VSPIAHVLWETLLLPTRIEVLALSLTSQARYVRVPVPRRAIHASGDSPWHLSAKHHVLETCLLLMTPFRSMLLTVRGGPQCLAPRAQGVPVYPKVFRHSYRKLSRRTAFAGYLCTVSRPSPSGPLPCARLSRTRTTMPYLTACWALEFRLGFPMPTLHPPCHPLQALPCSR
jgi:hypothetical protein